MTKKHDNHAQGLAGDEPGGWISNFLAEEEELDRRGLWRLGSWGVGTVGALIVGILATQSPVAVRRDQLAAAETQSQQVQWIAKDSQNKTRQLTAAVDTLNADRDRLYARVTVLEENLESVTGSIAKQKAAAVLPAIPVAPQAATTPAPETTAAVSPDLKSQASSQPTPPPKIAPVASIPSPALSPAPVEQKAAAAEPAKTETAVTGALATNTPASSDAVADKPVQQTAFGVELGGANSVEGLRAIWRTVNKTNGALFGALQPIVVLREGQDGLGMKLRLVAGPLNDVAAAAKICAVLIADKRACLPSVYDGQRLAMQDEKKPDAKPAQRKRSQSQTAPPPSTGFSSIFGLR